MEQRWIWKGKIGLARFECLKPPFKGCRTQTDFSISPNCFFLEKFFWWFFPHTRKKVCYIWLFPSSNLERLDFSVGSQSSGYIYRLTPQRAEVSLLRCLKLKWFWAPGFVADELGFYVRSCRKWELWGTPESSRNLPRSMLACSCHVEAQVQDFFQSSRETQKSVILIPLPNYKHYL